MKAPVIVLKVSCKGLSTFIVHIKVKVMCSKVEAEVNAFTQELDKFSARWHQLKPKDNLLEADKEAAANALASLKERRAEFDELLQTSKRLQSECEHFGLERPEFQLIGELEEDISKHEKTWSLYEEFSRGLEQLCGEDWISFRYVAFIIRMRMFLNKAHYSLVQFFPPHVVHA